MSGKPWYKRYGADFIEGTMGLSLEEKGAYSLCLDLIYSHGGPIADDARWLAGICNVSLRKWKAIRESLIQTGKIIVVDGRIDARIVHEWTNISGGREAIPTHVRAIIRNRDGGRCVYCGERNGPFHFDHIIPWSRGGRNTIDNLVLACAPCNLSKGAKTPEEWVQ